MKTFAFRPYLLTLTNGTSAMVKNIPQNMPANRPAKFNCQGSVPTPKISAVIHISLNRATCGLRSCFQWISISNTIRDAITPDNDANGPT